MKEKRNVFLFLFFLKFNNYCFVSFLMGKLNIRSLPLKENQ